MDWRRINTFIFIGLILFTSINPTSGKIQNTIEISEIPPNWTLDSSPVNMSEYLYNYELNGWEITYDYLEMKSRFTKDQKYTDEGFVLVDYSNYDLGISRKMNS